MKMAQPGFLKPGGRPNSPLPASWFEFLLHPELLLKHLTDGSIPGPHQLIIQFIQQASALELVVEDQKVEVIDPSKEPEKPTKEDEGKTEKSYHKKKARALKILALQIASFLNWDLKSLMKEIPGPVMLQLLNELLLLCIGKADLSDEALIEALSKEDQTDQAFFALLLYQRWCLYTVMEDCMPRKPLKVNSISVPGLTEMVVQMVNISDEKMNQIKKLFGKCKTTLADCLNMKRNACQPHHSSFTFATSAMDEVKMDWSKGKLYTHEEWTSEIAFALGCIDFFEGDYHKAHDMFSRVLRLKYQTVLEASDQERLTGYLKACQVLVNKTTYEENKINQFHTAIQQRDIKKLCGILPAELDKPELPTSACDFTLALIREMKDSNNSDDLVRLECLCGLLTILKGEPFYVGPNSSTYQSQHWKELLPVAIESSSVVEETYLKPFVKTLCSQSEELMTLPDVIDLMGNESHKMDSETSLASSLLTQEHQPTKELSLVLTYDPQVIWSQICAIHATSNLKSILDYWKLPKDLDRLFNELPKDLHTVCAIVLVVKAKELIAMQNYSQAIVLLNAAEKTIRDLSGKIAKVVCWEMLYSNLLATKLYGGNAASDLGQQVKTCLSSLKSEVDIFPHESLIMECVSFLLLSKDWEYLSSLHDTRVAFPEYARQLINVCKELPEVEFAKAPGKVLWDTSVTIFSLQNTGKRVRLGNQAMLPKDTYKKFLLTIKEPLVLSVLISLLSRVYNMKNSDEAIDKANNFSAVWPESNLNQVTITAIDEVFVRETLIQLVQHALHINASESTWLKTYAEIQYAVGNMKEALKYYLLSASVATNNFMQPIPPYVFDSQLNNFTQAAILCQFFEEPDYAAAFKYLQEKSCLDGMDIYYGCLWDVNIMEFLINLHDRRGEIEKKQFMIQQIGNPEVNSNNPDVILQTVKAKRKAAFFRQMSLQYS